MAHKRVYMSGPITGNEDYIDDFRLAEELAVTRFPDAVIVNPALMGYILTTLEGEIDHGEYMRYDKALLSVCDTILMLPGFGNSDGALEEMAFALANNISICYLHEDGEIEMEGE